MRIRETFVLENRSGEELLKIQEKKLTVRDKMEIERDGHTLATVKKALIGIRDRYSIEVEGGDDLHAKGNFVDHEFEIERDGHKVAEISKKWLRVRDAYGIEIARRRGRGADAGRDRLHRPDGPPRLGAHVPHADGFGGYVLHRCARVSRTPAAVAVGQGRADSPWARTERPTVR